MKTERILEIRDAARQAHDRQDWNRVLWSTNELIAEDAADTDDWFWRGRAQKATRQLAVARESFHRALDCDNNHHPSGIELASVLARFRQNNEAFRLLEMHAHQCDDSVMLDLAATTYVEIDMPERALPLYEQAHSAASNAQIEYNLATCLTYAGELESARDHFEALLLADPDNPQIHYQLSRISKARDDTHIARMQRLIPDTSMPAMHHTPLLFAMGKEWEDLEEWNRSFACYDRACSTIARNIDTSPTADIALIGAIIDSCDANWLDQPIPVETTTAQKTPVFITGLPRTGTTLVERILSGHKQVNSLGETLFLPMALTANAQADIPSAQLDPLSASSVPMLAGAHRSGVPSIYTDMLAYRLDDRPHFIDKLPMNFLYLGMLARMWPDARLIVVNRNPMDTCFSLYKQVFSWACHYSYTLEHLGQYFVAHYRLLQHWKQVLGERMHVVEYEDLVCDTESQVRKLLQHVGLEHDPACMDITRNQQHSTTASAIQVRSPISRASMGRWQHYAEHLKPLQEQFVRSGIKVD